MSDAWDAHAERAGAALDDDAVEDLVGETVKRTKSHQLRLVEHASTQEQAANKSCVSLIFLLILRG